MFLRLKRLLGIAPHSEKTPAEILGERREVVAAKAARAEELAQPFNDLMARRAAMMRADDQE